MLLPCVFAITNGFDNCGTGLTVNFLGIGIYGSYAGKIGGADETGFALGFGT